MLDEWHSALAHISPHLDSGRLTLSLVCDVDHKHSHGLEAAKLAVAPLHLLPRLKDCHIRLSKTPDSRLKEVAQAAVERVRGIATPFCRPPSTSTTLTTLPREVRLRILEYTDLIAPYKQVMWRRQYHGYQVFPAFCGIADGLECEPEKHHGCQFTHCWKKRRLACGRQREPTIGCFCRHHHSAFSSTCKCWAPPGPSLFLICRILRQDAEFVFFSGNCFAVHDYRWYFPANIPKPRPVNSRLRPRPESSSLRERPGRRLPGIWTLNANTAGDYPSDRFAISQFLREVVPTHCLAYLRFLELVFPPYRATIWPQAEHQAVQDWQATIDWARDKLNAPGLTIRLIMNDVHNPGDLTDPANRGDLMMSAGSAILEGYRQISDPLRLLAADGLARFYAQVADPWAHTPTTFFHLQSIGKDHHTWYNERQRHLGEGIRRRVMGDHYESSCANDKEEPARSFWQEKFALRCSFNHLPLPPTKHT